MIFEVIFVCVSHNVIFISQCFTVTCFRFIQKSITAQTITLKRWKWQVLSVFENKMLKISEPEHEAVIGTW